MTQKMKQLIIVYLVLFISGCDSQNKITQSANQNSTIENNRIENTHWTLIEFDGKVVPESVVGKVYIELSDKDHRLNGSNGCNRIMGDYNISNELQISFSKVASTMMACENQGWNESEFNKIFETANNFNISGDRLMLNTDSRMPLAVFVKTTKESITNKYWKLKKLNRKEVRMADNQEREQYFILKEDNTVSGFAGCNQFSGGFSLEQEKSRIKFKNMISTLRACLDVKIDEAEFLEIFNRADRYSISGDILTLNIGRDAPIAVFEAIYF